MVTFTHRDESTSPETWEQSDTLAAAPPLEGGIAHLVLFAAHPDDETLGAGALIRRTARAGGRIHLVLATLGERSHPDSPTHSPERLAEIREGEALAAAALLAPNARVTFLRLPDGGLAGSREELRSSIAQVLDEAGPAATVACTWRGDGHTDHEALGEEVTRAAGERGLACLEYPIWLWHWGGPGDLPDGLHRLDLSAAERAAKRDAMALHASQTRALSPAPGDEALLGPAVLAHFEGAAEYFVVTPRPGTPDARDPVAVFDDLHRRRPDPWRVDSSWYERRKRAVTCASLPRERYAHALEVGCSIGALAEDLAVRADRLLAVDQSEEAVTRAAERLRDAPHVEVRRALLPSEWPDGRFDLVVLSEMGYFCTQRQLEGLLARATGALEPGGHLVACHWRHPVEGWPLDGDDVHRTLHAVPGLAPILRHEEADFLLEIFEGRPK